MIELARDAPDGRLVPDVRRAKPAGGHAAQVIAELGDDRRLAHARRLHRRRHAARRSAINAHVGFDHLRSLQRPQRQEAEQSKQEAKPPAEATPSPSPRGVDALRSSGFVGSR